MDAREKLDVQAQIDRLEKMVARTDVDDAYKPAMRKQIEALKKQIKV